jgi:hypothetical protein
VIYKRGLSALFFSTLLLRARALFLRGGSLFLRAGVLFLGAGALMLAGAFVLTTGSGCAKSAKGGSSVPVDTLPLAGTIAQTDTLRVMAYNVLNYGDDCQSLPQNLDVYFRTIIAYAHPDLLSCEKMNAFPSTPGAAYNSADEITNDVLNADFPGEYAYGTPTNLSNGSTMSTLFYNKQKLTYVRTETLVADITDFDLYKLYYNDVNLSITHDTTFLFVMVNHTQSGSSSTDRDAQVTQEMQALRGKFAVFPNLINMGDFNTASSLEAGYQAMVTSTDSATLLYNPPYYPDAELQYPGNWDVQPYLVYPYLTTSTRLSASIPNSCGTSGGAKSWYDHICLSPWLVKGSNYIQYLPHSYQTLGNDGNRFGVDINSTTPEVNASAPDSVINALWQLSNKYPVTVKLIVHANRNGQSPEDPVEHN